MNRDKKLEEAVIFLKKVAKEYKIYGDLDNPEFEDTKKIAESIETVLKYLDYYQAKVEKYKFMLSNDVIPKKKIEDKIEENSRLFFETKDVRYANRFKVLKELLDNQPKEE